MASIEAPGSVSVAVVVFASTNIDDMFLLAAFFADRRLAARSVVIGQFLGIAALTAMSAVAAFASLIVPEGYIALLGSIPLLIGLRRLAALRRFNTPEATEIESADTSWESRSRSQIIAVCSVTIANGGDNLGVYIPLFAKDPSQVVLYAIVFAAMTALWCFVAYRLLEIGMIGTQIRRYGHLALPFVLIALGIWILQGARVLLR